MATTLDWRAATFLGEAHALERYALHVQGLPMVDRNNPVSVIHAELHLVDQATFADLNPVTTNGCRPSGSVTTIGSRSGRSRWRRRR
jgi:hypothetical protein